MRFLKTLTLNPRALYDDRLAITTIDSIVMNTPKNLLIPKGVASNRPGSPSNGMIRYNTDSDQFEGYQAGAWRSFKFKEPSLITQQAIGTGNGTNTVFGPLNPQPATTAASGVTWDLAQQAKQILVVVGNVIQISNTNYVILLGENINNAGAATPGYPYINGQKYIQFTSGVPGLSTPVVVLHGFDQ